MQESFHSGCGAVQESLVVYLRNSGVFDRLRSGKSTRVLEYGFGTSTAFLLTAAWAEVCQTPLTYVGIERHFLPAAWFGALEIVEGTRRYLENSDEALPDPDAYCAALARLQAALVGVRGALPEEPAHGHYQFQLGRYVTLGLWLGDARMLQAGHATELGEELFDAIYFDPFSPSTNPELWTQDVFCMAQKMLASRGTLTSYCVKGVVRNALTSAGFSVTKVPGPAGGKREVLLAINDRA